MPSASPSAPEIEILIVEDDKAIHTACSLLFQHYEFKVTVVSTLAEGRRLLEKSPSLLILDLALPDGDGLSLLEKVRSTGQQTRVFILTGDESRETARKIRRWMPDRFFQKPLNFLELLNAARDLLKPEQKSETSLNGNKCAA